MYFYLWTDRGENLRDRRGVPDMGLSEFAGDIFSGLQMANKDVQMGVKMFFDNLPRRIVVGLSSTRSTEASFHSKMWIHSSQVYMSNKKLCCRKEAARCFVSVSS